MSVPVINELNKTSIGVRTITKIEPQNEKPFFHKHKLENLDEETHSSIIAQIKDGAKFIIFYYRVSYVVISLQKVSSAVFIRDNKEFEIYKKRYNNRAFWSSILFFPLGPLLSFIEINKNNKGGLDVTGDIVYNLTQEAVQTKEVTITKMYTLFTQVAKNELKYFNKILLRFAKYNPNIQEIYIGTFINSGAYQGADYYIGTLSNSPINFEEMKSELYTEFQKFITFAHVDLGVLDNEENIPYKLKTQGQLIFKRN